jgi:hypothetical protein
MRDDCPDCNPPIGSICPAHCLGEYCRDGVHVDLCVGPTRNRHLEMLHRHGVEITEELTSAVVGVERAFNDMMRNL